MSGIAGFYHPEKNFMEREEYYHNQLKRLNRSQKKRGPDDSGTYLSAHCGLSQVRLAISGLEPSPEHIRGVSLGHEPALLRLSGRSFALVMDGEIYNQEELLPELQEILPGSGPYSCGSLLLAGYIKEGPDFIKKVNGVFAAAVYDPEEKSLFLFRDRLGIKPLFYTRADGDFLFASQVCALLSWPGVRAELDEEGLNEVFSIGPARTPGKAVFRNIREVLPGHFLALTPGGQREIPYWELESRPHEDSCEETVEKTGFLIRDAVRRQLAAEVPVCTFLSGGVDSSLVSAICAEELKKKNRRLTTYSFEFQDSEKYFKASSYQPSLDAPYVKKMVEFLDSDHTVLTCTSKDQYDALFASVDAHDLPNMADVDSSMLWFCTQVGDERRIALTGECADEIFGGYPWFHRPELFSLDTFPWSADMDARKVLLKDSFAASLDMDGYVERTYRQAVSEVPLLEGETGDEKKRRILFYLNLRWVMQTLLNRMDRDAATGKIGARVPFADYRIVEYLWNVPWEMKSKNGVVKGLLREAGRGLLPEEILFRRKSPYPKTYDTGYEAMLAAGIRRILDDSSAPILPFLDRKKTEAFLTSPADYGRPWYGQLMAAPQMMAYMLQLNDWMKKYHVTLV